MMWILIFGLLLTIGPILGFMICGTVMLYAALNDDGADRVFVGLFASIAFGAVLLVIYASLKVLT